MNDKRLEPYRPMWTSEKERYGLVEIDPQARISCAVFDLRAMAPMTIDDDDEIVEEVIGQMRSAGVRMLSLDEVGVRSKL